MQSDEINKNRLIRIFECLDREFNYKKDPDAPKNTVCIFGSCAVILHGQISRVTQDIDVWKPASTFNETEMKNSLQKMNIGYNPINEFPEGTYMQLVEDGVVSMPSYEKSSNLWGKSEKSETLWSGNSLEIIAPPVSILAAAKMVRFSDKDVQDIMFLIQIKKTDIIKIKEAMKLFPNPARREGLDNTPLLELIIERNKTKSAPKLKEERTR